MKRTFLKTSMLALGLLFNGGAFAQDDCNTHSITAAAAYNEAPQHFDAVQFAIEAPVFETSQVFAVMHFAQPQIEVAVTAPQAGPVLFRNRTTAIRFEPVYLDRVSFRQLKSFTIFERYRTATGPGAPASRSYPNC